MVVKPFHNLQRDRGPNSCIQQECVILLLRHGGAHLCPFSLGLVQSESCPGASQWFSCSMQSFLLNHPLQATIADVQLAEQPVPTVSCHVKRATKRQFSCVKKTISDLLPDASGTFFNAGSLVQLVLSVSAFSASLRLRLFLLFSHCESLECCHGKRLMGWSRHAGREGTVSKAWGTFSRAKAANAVFLFSFPWSQVFLDSP